MSENTSGFVINKENATAKDVVDLIHDVQRIVYEKFQVQLETEVKFLGEFLKAKEAEYEICNCYGNVRCGKKYRTENTGRRRIFLRG